MTEGNGSSPENPTAWQCRFGCGTGDTEPSPDLAATAKALHEIYCDRNPDWK